MRKLAVLVVVLGIACSMYAQKGDAEKRAAEMVSKMTLAEKIGQMSQITVDLVCKGQDTPPTSTLEIDADKVREAVVKYHVGSILNAPGTRARTPQWWTKAVEQIQEVATKETRMKIPVIYGLDQIHGATYTAGSTMFPQEIGIAATWNPAHARKMGEITAYETRASNVPWNFSPVLDLGLDPRFPRQYEGFGEDPYIGSVFGYELVKGYEGDDNNIANPTKVASCIKHFIGYSAPISGKDRTPAYIPENVLLEYHVPAFKAAIDAGAHTIMINSGIINNVPVHASYELMTKLLRQDLGFQGMIVTDWEDINKLYNRDKMVPSIKEAIKAGINAGIDMSMIPYNYKEFCDLLTELVNEGQVPMSRIDDAATRVLTVKIKLGLFETPNTYAKDYPEFNSKAFQQASYNAAADGITLLKNNNNVLPLSKGAKILVTGPNAVSKRALNGGWTFSWQGEKIDEFGDLYHNILDAVQQKFGKANVSYVPGVSYTKETKWDTEHKDRFDEAIAAAKNVDYIILCLGENSYCEKPGDLNDLYLNDLQTELAQEMLKLGKKVILVLSEGRPRLISKFSSKVDGIIQTYLPGIYGADALADILAGDVNPSGKLPYTYPAYPNSLVPYFHKYSDEQVNTDAAYNYEGDYNFEYPFGYGLSYTTFTYSNIKLDKSQLPLNSNEEVTVSVDVKNTGSRDGKEVVQLYTSDLVASLVPDVKRLRRFEKVALKAGETKTVTFKLKLNDLSFINLENKRVVEPGDFEFQVGASSNDIKGKVLFTIK
ncbi:MULTISPECIES: glycoside hydrolase family 3 N-terminal domain-containing protein [Dysgonomonas]|uniref:glycoside hydrolase family 3 N-terminal domain-containing protein n=1 Tax=Dysgonomonas TaxID=156973 RepID=UPI0009290CE7|nr:MULTISPECIES: glycoside hydrolase family 3 N-terminal domain-containing protein [Dysgonomonas]MBN9301736.1 glycoside hydrolase family 3 C-terminal domain-containing protein [Dysgonomonas mossii]OJX61823.1 MAG: beta-glucosidase [Dysgonomonas sp. 37-18]